MLEWSTADSRLFQHSGIPAFGISLPSSPPHAAAVPRLRILTGPRQDEMITIPSGVVVRFGRSPDCEVHLPDDRASREHAQLTIREDGAWIEDLGSSNGTWINGQRQQRANIRGGDVLMVGGTAMRLEDETVQGDMTLVQCLLEIQRLLGSDDERMIERSLETLFMILPASRLSLFVVDDEGALSQGFTTTRRAKAGEHMSHSFAKRVLASGKAMLIETGSDSEAFNVTMQQQQVRTALGVPVRLAGRAVGVLLCDNLEEPGRLDASHLRLMEFAAEALSHVFQRQELHRLSAEQSRAAQEFLAARRVQEQIFTKDPAALPGPMRWSAIYQAALELGGDFYDFHHDAHGTMWVVADVSGKGVPAALVVSMLKAFCKSLYPRGLGPRDLILELDHLLRGEMPSTMFLTIAVIRIAPDGTLTVSGVGHPPVLVARRDGEVDDFETTPGMLGLWPRDLLLQRVTETTTQIRPGDRIFICTDGLTEAMDPGSDMYGIERVRSNLAAGRDLEPAAYLRHMLDSVSSFVAGAPWADDLTMIVGSR
jgi:serine phosphatase RsbU (regulator of sigma subunit)/pSer/pThr/pTyr-binding forkhead associated (FHA) protein